MPNPNPSDSDIERYLNKTGIGVYIQDALTLVLENRPEHPIRFLAEYFHSTIKPGSPFARAYRYIRATPRYRPAFMSNLVSAFIVLDTYSNGSHPSGLIFKDLMKLLELLTSDFPIDVLSPIMQSMKKSPSDLIDFEVFHLCVVSVLMLEELFEKLEWLFKGCDVESTGYLSFSVLNEILAVMKRNSKFPRNMTSGEMQSPDKFSTGSFSYKEFLTIILQRVSLLPQSQNAGS